MAIYMIITGVFAALVLIYIWISGKNKMIPAQLARTPSNTGVLIHNLPKEMYNNTDVLCEVRLSSHIFDKLEANLQGGVLVTGRENIPIYEIMEVGLSSPDNLHDIKNQGLAGKGRVVIDKNSEGLNDYFVSWIWRLRAQKVGETKFLISYAPIVNGAIGIPEDIEFETKVSRNYEDILGSVLKYFCSAVIGAIFVRIVMP